MINIKLLSKICEIPGAPSFEKNIRNYILQVISPWVDEIKIDNIGNLIALKKGNNNPEGKKVMVSAHMDEIGFIVTHIDDKGFLWFHPLGGFDPKTLTAQRVIVHGKQDLIGVMGSKPIHVMSAEEKNRVSKIEDYFIDLGMNKEEIEQLVSIGDPITRERSLIEMGNCLNCKSLDNRISVYVLIEVLKTLKNNDWDVYAVFSVQEEVGLRGASVAAHSINPDFGIAIDTTIAYDVPNAKPQEKVTELGKGVAIKLMDSSAISDQRMIAFLKKVATEHQIIWQPEILTAGGTDTAPVQRNGKNGSIAGAISIPTRHIHQVIEMVHKKDVLSAIDLLSLSLQKIATFNWIH